MDNIIDRLNGLQEALKSSIENFNDIKKDVKGLEGVDILANAQKAYDENKGDIKKTIDCVLKEITSKCQSK